MGNFMKFLSVFICNFQFIIVKIQNIDNCDCFLDKCTPYHLNICITIYYIYFGKCHFLWEIHIGNVMLPIIILFQYTGIYIFSVIFYAVNCSSHA